MPKKRVEFFYRTAEDPGHPRSVGSDHFGPEDMPDVSLSLPCPFCGETPEVDFNRPEGEWPDTVLLVCASGRTHRLDEGQPQRVLQEYPKTIGWERCPQCDASARREVPSAEAGHVDVLCSANAAHNRREEE